MRVGRCRGTRDLSPEEMTRFRFIEGVFRDCCLRAGYQEIRTPTIEYLHLFTSTGTLTPGKLSKVYSFLDWDGWSGERVVLRPDATIPVVRSYVEMPGEPGLAKLFYVANIFSFEETGRDNREIWQCGVELIGAGSVAADVELISLLLEVLTRLGLKHLSLKLSHAGLARALLARFGLSPQEQAAAFDQILDGNRDVLTRLVSRSAGLGEALTPLLDLRGQSPGFLRNLRSVFSRDLPGFRLALNNFIEIVDLLERLGARYEVDITSGKGFEYYTGVMFQVFDREERVAGGGRYDDLIPLMGGRQVPASGFALEMEHLFGRVSPPDGAGGVPEMVLIRTGDKKPETVLPGLLAARSLREAGYAAEVDLGGRLPAGTRWTVDVRERSPRFIVTDLTSQAELEVDAAEDVVAVLGGRGAG